MLTAIAFLLGSLEFLDLSGEKTVATRFVQRFPTDGAPSTQRTEVRLSYDEESLYVQFICHDTEPERIRARMLARGTEVREDDYVSIQLDTFRDQRRAYAFSANPLGIQSTAMWIEGQGWDDSFDTVWSSDGRLTDDGYVVSMTIPFKSLRFPDAATQSWGVMLERKIPRNNEEVYWPRYSSRIEGRLNQAGVLTGIENVSPGRNLQLIPYGAFHSVRARDVSDFDEPRAGIDMKYVVNKSLVLDLTLNPDFSQVETDSPQVTVNQRFEVFFPEKRPFFLENASAFQTPINLLFTRRIREPSAGLRVTGKLGPYSLGALVSDDDAAANADGAVMGAFRVARDVGEQSSVGAMYTHWSEGSGLRTNQVGGIDGRFKLGTNWTTSLQAVASTTMTPEGEAFSGPAVEVAVNRAGRQLNYDLALSDRSPGFRTALGFEPRPDVRSIHQLLTYRFRPEGERLIAFGPDVVYQSLWDHDGTRLGLTYGPAFKLEFTGQTELGIYALRSEETLRPEDHHSLDRTRSYDASSRGVLFSSRLIPEVSVDGSYAAGAAINLAPHSGEEPESEPLTSANVGIVLRPMTPLTIDNRYLYTRLGRAFTNHIVQSRWNYQLTRSLAVRAILQYDTLFARERTSLETTRNVNVDLLLTYFLHHGTALYVGYNGNRERSGPLLPPALPRDQYQLFVKLSYLVRF